MSRSDVKRTEQVSNREVIADLVRAKVEFQLRAISTVLTADVRNARPVVTQCPICDRDNPCPLHPFTVQMDHRRSRGE